MSHIPTHTGSVSQQSPAGGDRFRSHHTGSNQAYFGFNPFSSNTGNNNSGTSFFSNGYQANNSFLFSAILQLIQQLLAKLIEQLNQQQQCCHRETQSIDGSGNNRQNPSFGTTDSPFRREFTQDPERGIGGSTEANLPSTRAISNAVSAQSESTQNAKGLSDMFWLWGQFLDHDINITHPEDETANIAVPFGDSHFDPMRTGSQEIPFHRSHVFIDENGNRQQTNGITAFIDGSNVYGSDTETSDSLRSFSRGQLKASNNNLLPIGNNGMFQAGDIRVNEQPGLTAMHTLWMREHNRIADKIADQCPTMTDEEIFQEARKQVIAEIQAVTANEFLPALLGSDALQPYSGYNENIDPQISQTFATSAYRFGHSMVSPTLQRLDEQGNEIQEGHLSLIDGFFNPQHVMDTGIDPLLRGFATQVAQAADPMLVDELRNLLFGPPGAGGLDLVALNIQRGRDHELPSYNDMRDAMGFERITSFNNPIFQGDFGAKLAEVYDNPDDIDSWVGGMAEKPDGDALLGETMTQILASQFERLRDGDRFWYENCYSGADLHALNNLHLSDIIRRNTDIQNIQDHAMIA